MSAHSENEHVIGYMPYITIWLTLIGLTILTVSISLFDLGTLTIIVAMIIAIIKSIFVINIFMHIKYDSKVFLGFIIAALVILLVCLVFTATDVFFR